MSQVKDMCSLSFFYSFIRIKILVITETVMWVGFFKVKPQRTKVLIGPGILINACVFRTEYNINLLLMSTFYCVLIVSITQLTD